MKNRRRWLWLTTALVLIAAVAALLLWLNWDWGYGEMKAKYDLVAMRMKLEEAEAVLGLQQGDPSWKDETAPFTIEEQEATGPFSIIEMNYYSESQYVIVLWYETSTTQIIRKELLKKPNLWEVIRRKYFEPRWGPL